MFLFLVHRWRLPLFLGFILVFGHWRLPLCPPDHSRCYPLSSDSTCSFRLPHNRPSRSCHDQIWSNALMIIQKNRPSRQTVPLVTSHRRPIGGFLAARPVESLPCPSGPNTRIPRSSDATRYWSQGRIVGRRRTARYFRSRLSSPIRILHVSGQSQPLGAYHPPISGRRLEGGSRTSF